MTSSLYIASVFFFAFLASRHHLVRDTMEYASLLETLYAFAFAAANFAFSAGVHLSSGLTPYLALKPSTFSTYLASASSGVTPSSSSFCHALSFSFPYFPYQYISLSYFIIKGSTMHWEMVGREKDVQRSQTCRAPSWL
jgi:hypothetical protein